MQTTRSLLFATLFAMALGGSAAAQNTVSLEGIVRAEGFPVENAQVTVVNDETRETARTTTRWNGEFRIIGLFPGKYAVSVRAVGYRPASDKVEIIIGQRARLDFTLDKGVAELQATQVLEERIKHVEVQRLSVSAPVMITEIENLPLNSRGVMNLAGIAPGIKTYAPQSGRETREFLGEKANEARARAAEAAAKGRDALNQGRDTLTTAIERGREAYQQARTRDTA